MATLQAVSSVLRPDQSGPVRENLSKNNEKLTHTRKPGTKTYNNRRSLNKVLLQECEKFYRDALLLLLWTMDKCVQWHLLESR